MMSLKVLELTTEENFDECGYLLANPDIRTHIAAGGDAIGHFHSYGKSEGRMQISPTLFSQRQARFERLVPLIDMKDAKFIEKNNAFPIAFSDKHFTMDDYAKGESANNTFFPFAEEIKANPKRHYIDIGCGFRDEIFDNCLYLEVYPSLTADIIVEPNCKYPIKSASVDGIGCFAVLEHVTKPWMVVEEMHRMLKPGGKVFIDWPFLQPVHGYPSHFFNATRDGLSNIFKDAGFEIASNKTYSFQTPDYTISWILGKFINDIPDAELREKILNMSTRELIAHKPSTDWWINIIKTLPDHMVSEFACGNTLIATKQ